MNKELSKGFTGIEINGVKFSNISEMLQYMNRQRERLAELEKACDETQGLLDKQIEATYKVVEENTELKEQISTKDILIKELQEQKVYWKESSFDWRRKFFKLDKVKRLIKKDKQLTKAKIYLEQLVSEITVGELEVDPNILQQAENFLKE